MPQYSKLTKLEQALIPLALLLVVSSIVLALCIGLVLPVSWVRNQTMNCSGCKQTRSGPVDILDCTPHVLPERGPIYHPEEAETQCENIQHHAYLVSLTVPAYFDDLSERWYACAGTILSENWVLAGKHCVKDQDEWLYLKIRAGTPYWSQKGSEYDVTAVSKFSSDGPMALKASPSFIFSKFISAAKLPQKNKYLTWNSGVVSEWRNAQKRYYDMFRIQRWSTMKCKNCQHGMISEDGSCDGKPSYGNVLITDTRHLVAIQSKSCSKPGEDLLEMFTDLQMNEYVAWFEYLIENANTTLQTDFNSDKFRGLGPRPSKILVYEIKECVDFDPNYSETVILFPETSKKQPVK